MRYVYSDIIQFRGSHYDFGYMQGELLKNSPILENRKKQWSANKRNFHVDEKIVVDTMKRFSPAIMEEINGLADSLAMNTKQALIEFGGYYLEYGRSGCSTFSGENFLIRNYDNDPITYEGRYVAYQPTDGGYATIGPTMQITGRTDGLNEKGLALGYNFVHRKKSDDGFVCNMIGRIVLENCANTKEAIDLLQEVPHRHSFNYILLDHSGESTVVECSPRKVTSRKSNACTNHFEVLTDENRYRMDDSIKRMESMQKQESDITDGYKAFRMMNDINGEVFSTKYGAWAGTIHTTGYFPKELKAWLSLGGDRPPYIVNFNEWLQGKNLHATKVKGELYSHSIFVNMERL
ncbi:C45 family autoproteolytic acyltransferase/hydolase [Oceanobacillus senegalensis]|uniref:C45 family autoproteolytic acyltransferase/hydolase n=1 Tax=Oceanobacillus senegalensis TaxID=1936063 RepID=UPI000A311F96|nr:C45 family peptidase [Oceanobacillus senegalensis]